MGDPGAGFGIGAEGEPVAPRPPTSPFARELERPGRNGNFPASKTRVTPEARATFAACPNNPKPVMSVAAFARASTAAAAAPR